MLSTSQLEVLYNKYYILLIKFATKYTRSAEIAADIVPEVFIRAYEKLKDKEGDEKSWLIHTTANMCVDYFRKSGKIKKAERIVCNEFTEEMKLHFIESEVEQALICNINNLPGQCKKIFLLYWGGASTEYICSSMGISIQNALNQKTRAIKLIKQSIAKYYI